MNDEIKIILTVIITLLICGIVFLILCYDYVISTNKEINDLEDLKNYFEREMYQILSDYEKQKELLIKKDKEIDSLNSKILELKEENMILKISKTQVKTK